jgi:hypothetical protein
MTQLDACNQFAGRVKEVKLGNIMAEVVSCIGGENSFQFPVPPYLAGLEKICYGSRIL